MGRAGAVVTDERPVTDPGRKADELCALLSNYMDAEQVALVYRAYCFGAVAHADQRRLSGEPYITHPLAVARILAEMRMDSQSVAAAILHDVIEDTPTAKEQVAREFGEDIAELVDGVSKLTQIDFKSKAEAQAESFRKMVLAMSKDIRVILIKLADRLHNMRTIWVMRPDKRRRIAQETLEIYAPIAQRLGINTIRVELEDLSFAAMYPMRYRVLKEKLRRQRGARGETIDRVKQIIEVGLEEAELHAEVIGREKHLWSIYQKMRSKNRDFQDIFDVYGFRVIVDDIDSCYRVLGLLHGLYKPKPGRIKDYIAIPKANGYQSLHTSLVGPRRIRIEAQVRTQEMDKVAESGIAAHWMYKDNEQVSNTAQARAREWVKGLMEMQRSTVNPLEFIESVKVDLQPDEVYVFTPKGDIMKLPRGATVIDFAYTVHSDVGDGCIAAMVDHRLTPLRTELNNGQTVEVITAPGARPNPAWLDFVVTARARAAIRQSLKRLKGEAATTLGRRLLEQSLNVLGCSLDNLPNEQLEEALTNLGAGSVDVLLEEIGLGQRMPWLVAQQLTGLSGDSEQSQPMRQGQRLVIRGTEGAVVSFARCCHPIPGDPIVGFASAGRGVVVHHRDCANVREYRNQPDKWIDVQWEETVQGDFPVVLAVDVVNKRGVLAELASTIADAESNIDSVMLDEKEGMITTIRFTISVKDRIHLARVMRRLRVLASVVRLTRRRA